MLKVVTERKTELCEPDIELWELDYYISKKAKLSLSNLAGACGLAALFDIYIFTWPINYMIFSMYGTLGESSIQWTKVFMPFTLG